MSARKFSPRYSNVLCTSLTGRVIPEKKTTAQSTNKLPACNAVRCTVYYPAQYSPLLAVLETRVNPNLLYINYFL